MEKFQNQTVEGNEKAIKIGNKAVNGSVPLVWFTSNEIAPSNTLSVSDVSHLIPENVVGSIEVDNICFADELGMLRKLNGSSSFKSNDITVSNIFINKRSYTQEQDLDSLESLNFAHHYYLSRYFIAGPKEYYTSSFRDYLNPDKLVGLNIKVTNADGSEYVDVNKNSKKYRILLEPFKTETNQSGDVIPYRIIVLFDNDKPINVRLNYDKVQCDQDGLIYNQEINYTETVNSVPIFTEKPEESFVIDKNYFNENIFSVSKINQKHSDVFLDKFDDDGYQVFVPSKAIQDNRTYEVFNWRLIAKTKSSVVLNEEDFPENNDLRNYRSIKAGVLYSSSFSSSILNPYVFYRLENSPFNLSKFTFNNPIANSSLDKSKRDYWLVDLESDDLSQFDILVFTPNFELNSNHQMVLNRFVQGNGSLIIDLSRSQSGAPALANLSTGGSVSMQNVARNSESVILDVEKNGGWTISSDIFEKDYYDIHGSSKLNNGNYKTTKYFDNSSPTLPSGYENSYFIKHDGKATGVHITTSPSGDRIVGGNIFATSFPFLTYCNNIYSRSNSDLITSNNNGDTSIDNGSGNVFSAVIEGPFKALYNMVCYTLYSQELIKGSRVDFRSPLYNYVSDWRSSWVMDSNVILDREKSEYFSPVSVSADTTVYARDLLRDENVDSSISNFYKNELSKFLTDKQKARLGSIDSSQIDFYIEVTNPDVKLYNSSVSQRVANNSINGLSSSYYLYSISSANDKLFAYTQTISPELNIPDNIGPYVMMEKPISSSDSRMINDFIDRNAAFKNYKFSLETYYNYFSGSDTPQTFTAYNNGVVKATLSNILVEGGYYAPVDPIREEYTDNEEYQEKVYPAPIKCSNFQSAIDDVGLFRSTSTTEPTNVFPYTGDISLGNTTKLWRHDITDGSTQTNRGAYATYIQFTLWTYRNYWRDKGDDRNYYPYSLDQNYGSLTAAGVRKFQQAEGLRYIDGRVDSETKWYLAKFWKKVYDERRDIWNASMPFEGNRYITAAKDAVVAAEIGSKTYKKTTFSGAVGPKNARDVIFFELPSSLAGVQKIIIEADTSWSAFEVTRYGRTTDQSKAHQLKNAQNSGATIDSSGNIEINLGTVYPNEDNGRYMWIELNGFKIANHGNAEGFAIKSIKAKGFTFESATQEVTKEREIEQPDVWVPRIDRKDGIVEIVFTDFPVNVDPSTKSLVTLNSTESYRKLLSNSGTAYISSVSVDGGKTYTFTPGDYPISEILSGTNFTYVDNNVTLSLSEGGLSRYRLSSYVMDSVYNLDDNVLIWDLETGGESPVSMTSPEVSILSLTNIFTYETSSTYYADSQVVRAGPVELTSGFNLMNPDGLRVGTSDKDIINVNDGILLLCDNNNEPYGFPSRELINSSLNNINPNLDTEVDTRFGFFSVINTSPTEDGFIYGFYDNSTKDFIGTVISYIELMRRNQSGENVYIGVLAYDADGNTANTDYIGPSKDMTFTPVVLPMKYVAPVYSVSYGSRSAIKVNNISGSLSKFDAWQLPVTSGSFSKTITIQASEKILDWKKNYVGQDTVAFYETSRSYLNNWSDIYGYGSYDVVNENPVILDNEKISLRNTPLLSWNYKTDYLNSNFGIVKPIVKVYFRNSLTGDWDLVPEYNIRNIDCESGVIDFVPRSMPSVQSDIRVDYSVRSKDILLRQVDGSEIPLNPFLNDIDYTRPLYIYILPRKIYSLDSSSGSFKLIEDYESLNSVNFTYETDIFNKQLSSYNPYALPIAVISTNGNPRSKIPPYRDVRTRGGGIVDDVSIIELMNNNSSVLYNWDVYPPSSMTYPNGGYIVIKIPRAVEDNFLDKSEVYDIIRSNLTAGVAFDLQDEDGNSWS